MTTMLAPREAELVSIEPDPDPVSARLLEAADLLERDGWTQYNWYNRNPIDIDLHGTGSGQYPAGARCAIGAICKLHDNDVVAVLLRDPVSVQAAKRLAEHLELGSDFYGASHFGRSTRDEVELVADIDWVDAVSHWSETRGRTQREVVAALRAAAK